MCFITDWITPSSGIIVVNEPSVIEVFDKYIQDDELKHEAGGILLGYRRGQHFQIVHATEPTKYDKRSRHHFERSPEIHADIAIGMWRKSYGHITYCGEWHTHPVIHPSPSPLDRKEWKVLSTKLPRNKSYVMTIVGIGQLWSGVAHYDGSLTELAPVK